MCGSKKSAASQLAFTQQTVKNLPCGHHRAVLQDWKEQPLWLSNVGACSRIKKKIQATQGQPVASSLPLWQPRSAGQAREVREPPRRCLGSRICSLYSHFLLPIVQTRKHKLGAAGWPACDHMMSGRFKSRPPCKSHWKRSHVRANSPPGWRQRLSLGTQRSAGTSLLGRDFREESWALPPHRAGPWLCRAPAMWMRQNLQTAPQLDLGTASPAGQRGQLGSREAPWLLSEVGEDATVSSDYVVTLLGDS